MFIGIYLLSRHVSGSATGPPCYIRLDGECCIVWLLLER